MKIFLIELIFINLKTIIAENQMIIDIKIIRIKDKIKFKFPNIDNSSNKIK